MGGRSACVFSIGGLAAAHCAVIFWPPLPCLTIHRLPDDTVWAKRECRWVFQPRREPPTPDHGFVTPTAQLVSVSGP
jgi:hypothetical protein